MWPGVISSSRSTPSTSNERLTKRDAIRATADTGEGAAPIIDIGAFEFQVATCPADLTGDGVVGIADLLAVLAGWGTAGTDVTGDGTTDVLDLLALLAAWGDC